VVATDIQLDDTATVVAALPAVLLGGIKNLLKAHVFGAIPCMISFADHASNCQAILA
jgi:hypothetical protein